METYTSSKNSKNFILFESFGSILNQVPEEQINNEIIDPTTGKPYKGMILEGVFACLEILNNNNRIYTEEDYIRQLEIFKRMVHSEKGVYGELEHPSGYAVDSKNISHRILDVWYVPRTKTVYGRVLLLNTENGRKAQEIIRSGGQLGISARAAGKEIKNSDGTFTAKLGLLVTYDLVYHPGFTYACLNFVRLNESFDVTRKRAYENGINLGYSYILYEKDIEKLNESFDEYINKRNEEENKCYLSWFGKKLYENQKIDKNQDKEDLERLQNSETKSEDKIEEEMKNAAKKDLSEDDDDLFSMNESEILEFEKELFFKNLNENIQQKKKYSRQGASFFDGSAGFLKFQKNVKDKSIQSSNENVSKTSNGKTSAIIDDIQLS